MPEVVALPMWTRAAAAARWPSLTADADAPDVTGTGQLSLFPPTSGAAALPLGTTIRRRNPRLQGDLGVLAAMEWFGMNGYVLSLPLSESSPYDLLIDDGDTLQRVQVKTSTARTDRGHFRVHLSTNGGNRSGQTTRLFDPSQRDLLFVLTEESRYVIPTATFNRWRGSLTLGAKWEACRV